MMEIEEIRAALRSPSEVKRLGFDLVGDLCRVFAAAPESEQTQELILRALEQIEHLDGSADVVLSLARERGLFPYLPQEKLDFADQLAYEFHRPPGLGDVGIVFHAPQARVYWELMQGTNVILSAPTSFGKSLIIDAVVLSNRFRNILIVVPTIALMDETRRRLEQLEAGYKLITHLSQTPAANNIYVMTQERALENSRLDEIDFFVIDEFYKLNPDRGEDQRADTLNHIFYKLATAGKQFYMLGPSVQAIPPEVTTRFECKFLYEPYHTVVSELHQLDVGRNELEKVVEVVDQAEGPSIVYCSSPRKASIVAAKFASERRRAVPDEIVLAADWIASEFHPEWHLVGALRAGVGVHHGRIPRSLSQYVVHAFDSDLLDTLVCTSSLIEGVNTKAKNVVILDDTVNREKFDYFTFNNIRGRAGRMFRHFVGNVYLFHPPPVQALPFIDMPAVTQSEDASDALLLQLDDQDLHVDSKQRILQYENQKLLSIETMRLNAGIDPEAQLALASTIRQSPERYAALLGWKGYPTYEQLLTICELIWQNFNGRKLGGSSVWTSSQLAYRITALRNHPSIREMIASQLLFMQNRDESAPADAAVQNVLDFLRLWPGFHFPRLLMAIDRIQNEVLQSVGYPAGDFSAYATQAQNLFLDPTIPALEEYGIPIQLGVKLSRVVSTDGDLDLALERLRTVSTRDLTLSAFERVLLANAIAGF
jgi:hypothetical protein